MNPSSKCCRKATEALLRTHTKEELFNATITFRCTDCGKHYESRGNGKGMLNVTEYSPIVPVKTCHIEAAPGAHPDNCRDCGWYTMQERLV